MEYVVEVRLNCRRQRLSRSRDNEESKREKRKRRERGLLSLSKMLERMTKRAEVGGFLDITSPSWFY
jgi:hypothetical protein